VTNVAARSPARADCRARRRRARRIHHDRQLRVPHRDRGSDLSQLIPAFTDKFPPLLETLLGAADKLIDNVEFTLDTHLGTPVTTQLDSKIGSLDVVAGPATGASAGRVGVVEDLAIRSAGGAAHLDTRGAPRFDAASAQPPITASGVRLAMRLEVLNGLVHSLWSAGRSTVRAHSRISAVVAAHRRSPDTGVVGLQDRRRALRCPAHARHCAAPRFQQTWRQRDRGARIVVDGTRSARDQDVPSCAWAIRQAR
jgi:hypothetical protein